VDEEIFVKNPRRLLLSVVPFLVFAMFVLCAVGQTVPHEFDVKAHYTKYEFRIPMRDGVRLFTSVYVPKDASPQKLYPFLMTRTPYSVAPYGEDNSPTRLAPVEMMEAGYIFVQQDVRGRNMSEGKFVEMSPHVAVKKSAQDVDQSSDMYDTVEWLLKHVSYNNGRVGIWGVSYPGFFTSSSIIDSHPAIKAASPEAPMTNLFNTDDAYHNGAFMLGANFSFYNFFRPQHNPELPRPFRGESPERGKDAYQLLLDAGTLSQIEAKFFNGSNPLFADQMRHNTFDDYWKARDISRHFKNIHCAVLTVGGWFDAEDLQGPFTTFATIEKNNPGIFNSLVVGPWVHGGWTRLAGRNLGRVSFDSDTGDYYRKQIFVQFFEQALKGSGEIKLPKAYVFETGTNVWRQYPSWPPRQARAAMLYLQPKSGLGWSAPGDSAAEYDEYVSDPSRPVPYTAYNSASVPQEYMVSDQRFASTRPDVLVYQTEALENDVTIAGPISPKLFVSTSGTDSDFVAKLIDVYPDDYPEPDSTTGEKQPTDVRMPQSSMAGYQQLVRGEPMRAKFRHSWETPEAMTPGKVEEIDFSMPDVLHTFRRGHRIMVQIQSTWFPLIDRNPQTFVNIPDAKPDDFKKATERVYRWKEQPSGIAVQIMPAE
jgi:putative CocE/NonD family hydrolase